MRFTVDRLDHMVLTCSDVEQTASWYLRVLGMEREEFGHRNRTALRFGGQKINLDPVGMEARPNTASAPVPGAQNLCFVTAVSALDVAAHLHDCGVTIVEGPAAKIGALGPMTSVYCRDPDGNLIEIASYMRG